VNAKGARGLGGDQAGLSASLFSYDVSSHALPILTRSTCSASLIAHFAKLLYYQRSPVSVRKLDNKHIAAIEVAVLALSHLQSTLNRPAWALPQSTNASQCVPGLLSRLCALYSNMSDSCNRLLKPGIETTVDSVKGMALRSNHRDPYYTRLFEIFEDRSDKRLNTGDGSAKYQA
jgi:hypothetical protein